MKKNQNKWIVTFISVTILITICAQIYLLAKHFETSKHLLYKQVAFSLNKAVDTYFEDIAKGGIISLTSQDTDNPNKTRTDTLRIKDRFSKNAKASIDSTLNIISQTDSTKTFLLTPAHSDSKGGMKQIFKRKRKIPNHIDKLISKVYISYSRDSLKLNKLNRLFKAELRKNHIKFHYALSYSRKDKEGKKITSKTKGFERLPKEHTKINSSSSYFPHRNGKITVHYTDEYKILFKRALFDILLSLLLSASIVSCLLYLLYTINKQKKIASIKNDFISNITHEFKTPIATISAALEGVKSFNKANDSEKTEKYIDISALQIEKLNKMVEKLLETATLHSDQLTLEKKDIELVSALKNIQNKHQIISPNIEFEFTSDIDDLHTAIDIFHFENAIDNIFDNAVKYGGRKIISTLSVKENNILLYISDDGIGIKKHQTSKIFDQFYRVQKGNIHNTKGFGIGLYYTRKIIEKHNGKIYVDLNNNSRTTFIIELPK